MKNETKKVHSDFDNGNRGISINNQGLYVYKGTLFTGIESGVKDGCQVEYSFKNGKLYGLTRIWDKNGNLFSESDYDGKENWDRWYYENGQLKEEKIYEHGKGIGSLKKHRKWYENGQLKTELNCDGWDVEDGIYEDWYENGQLRSKTKWEDGEQGLIIELYDKKGNLIGENKYEIILSGLDNMSGYGNCDITLLLNESQWENYRDDDYYTSTPGGIIDLIEGIGYDKECVMVSRFQIFDKAKNTYYDISEIETFNSSEKNKELNKTYYRCGKVNYPNRVVYHLMNEEEIKEFEKEWEYNGDNRYFGIDVYSIENFDLELELKTDYLGGIA